MIFRGNDMYNESEIYFVHEIFTPAYEREGTSYISLMHVPGDVNLAMNPEFVNEYDYSGPIITENLTRTEGLIEGSFVRYREDGNRFEIANDTPIAQRYIQISTELRQQLRDKYVEPTRQNDDGISKICSYHINVGHGNFSVITFLQSKIVHVWIVDASEKEISYLKQNNKRKTYRENWQSCFRQIKNDYGISSFKVSKLFITHTHYDHFSAINQLFVERYFSSDLEVWLNLYYDCNNPAYVGVLSTLKKIPNIHLVEPICRNTRNHSVIRVLAPEARLYYMDKPSVGNIRVIQEKDANNASVMLE